MVMTTEGELPVEWLESGDRVITRDHGAQPILWIERWKGVDPEGLALPAPLRLEPEQGAAQDTLIEPLRLAPAHRVLVRAPAVEMHFGEDEMLAEIGDLSSLRHVRADDGPAVSYHNLVLARHALIWSCGIWVESVGSEMAQRLSVPAHVRARSDAFGPRSVAPRPCLGRSEARLIRDLLLPDQTVMALLAA